MGTNYFLCIILFVTCFLLIGCGNSKIINGKKYGTYGLLNKESKMNPNIQYELIVGNVIWSAILCETIIMPIYFVGFDLYEPVGEKNNFEPGVIQ